MEEVLYVSPRSMLPEYADKLQDALNIFKWQLGKNDTVMKGPDTVSSLYNIITYDEYLVLDPDYYRFRTVSKRWCILFKTRTQFIEAMFDVRSDKPYYWCRFRTDDFLGYEVTSKGDKRFSPIFMKLDNGVSLEEYYHLDLKGYRDKGYNNWLDVKGLPPIDPTDFDIKVKQVYYDYLKRYPSLLYELATIGNKHPFTDMFDVNGGQNKIYAEILNEIYPIMPYFFEDGFTGLNALRV